MLIFLILKNIFYRSHLAQACTTLHHLALPCTTTMKVGEIVCMLTGFTFRPTNQEQLLHLYQLPSPSNTINPAKHYKTNHHYSPQFGHPASFPPTAWYVPNRDDYNDDDEYVLDVLKCYLKYCYLQAVLCAQYQNFKWRDVWFGLFQDVYKHRAMLNEDSTRDIADEYVARFVVISL